jgi:hypothetical protein
LIGEHVKVVASLTSTYQFSSLFLGDTIAQVAAFHTHHLDAVPKVGISASAIIRIDRRTDDIWISGSIADSVGGNDRIDGIWTKTSLL